MRRLVATGVLLAALAGAAPAAASPAPVVRASHDAARAYRVPAALLLAIGYADTHWHMRVSEDGAHGPHAWGVMGLVEEGRGLSLRRAHRLTGIPRAQLETSMRANVLGAAAVLAAGSRPATLDGWYERLRKRGGAVWANEVFRVLADGVRARIGGRVVVLRAHPRLRLLLALTRDYGAAVWRPSPNYTAAVRTYFRAVDRIVVHTTEGSFASSVLWLQNRRAEASAHYVVGRAGQVAQLVRERDIAWHAGNWTVNARSVGVEHEGFAFSRGWFTETEYRTSARLVAKICLRYGIKIDRRHIIGHDEVPDPNHPGQWGGISHHRDPGPYWDWSHYIALVRAYAAELTVAELPHASVSIAGFADGDTVHGTIDWQAVPKAIAPSEIQQVSFWIDGVRRHVEYYEPYAYGKLGRLDTTTLPDGPHVLRVRLVTRPGHVLRKTATINVSNHVPLTVCPDGEYAAAYYVDTDRYLSGTPAATGCEGAPLAYDWGTGGPTGVGVDSFSARWIGRFAFAEGTYAFTVTGDDGVRLYVDGIRVLKRWRDQPPTEYVRTVALSAGTHTVELEYYEATGSAVAKLDWAPSP